VRIATERAGEDDAERGMTAPSSSVAPFCSGKQCTFKNPSSARNALGCLSLYWRVVLGGNATYVFSRSITLLAIRRSFSNAPRVSAGAPPKTWPCDMWFLQVGDKRL
jgi:hypothetical protein